MTPAAWLFAAIVAAFVLGAEYACWRIGVESRRLQRRTHQSIDRVASKLKEIK